MNAAPFLGKLLRPYPLITIYPRWQIDAGQWISYLPLAAAIVSLFFFWLKRELWSGACFFAFAYFTAALLPVLGLIDNFIFHYSLVFDHFQYLASIGPLALTGAGLAHLYRFIPKKRWVQSTLCAELLVILGLTSWQRTLVYQGSETLWTDTLAKNPNCWVAHNNLGLAFLQKGQVDEALQNFQEGLELNPSYEAHSNLGLALFQKGWLDQAIANFLLALEINPKSFVTRCDLANALVQKGRLDDAIVQYEKALQIDLQSVAIHNNLGVVLIQKGQPDEAIRQFQEALRLKPDFSPAKDNLSRAEAFERRRDGKK